MINLKMADGIRLMTLRRGVDPQKICAAEFWRRGRSACRRGRARTRYQAHHRADRGLRAVGMGHADQRFALRGQPHPLRRRRPHLGGRGAKTVRRAGAAGHRPAARLVRRADDDGTFRRNALRRADFRDRRRARRSRLGRGLAGRRRSRIASTAATKNSTPTPRATRKSCSSMPASPRSAKCRSADRIRGRRRRRQLARRARRGRPGSASGAKSRSMRSTTSGPATRWRGPRSSRPRPPRWWSMPATG